MIDVIDNALLAIQAAACGSCIYGSDHHAVQSQQRKAYELLTSALSQHPCITVSAFDDRIVWQDSTLPSSGKLLEGVFDGMRRAGFESISFRRGLLEAELKACIEFIEQIDDPGATFGGSQHITIGHVADLTVQTHAPAGGAGDTLTLRPRANAAAVRSVWQVLQHDASAGIESLTGIVANICTAVTMTRNAMIPLATLKHHDEYTFVHATNVAILSSALAESIGMNANQVSDITIAALLHDVGKRVIPHEVLNKTAKLTDTEWQIVHRHPAEGARLLLNTRTVPDVVPIVAYEHHMHLDGSGYPRKPIGWRIHLASQIVQVADVFDALRSARPYRPALEPEEAREIMYRDAAKLFDQALLDAFFESVAAHTVRDRAKAQIIHPDRKVA